MSRSLLPHAPALDEPLDILEACHERIEAQLQTLARLLAHLPAHGADEQARQAVAAILRYFEKAGPNHHEDEERDLFPLLQARADAAEAATVSQLVTQLLAEHGRMAQALGVVRGQLEAVQAGNAAALDAAAVERLTGLYRAHIVTENGQLLPLARRLLKPADIETISHAMTARRQATPAGQ